jgi:hypothetical protein
VYCGRWSPGLRQGDIFGQVLFPLAVAKLRQTSQAGAWLAGEDQATHALEMPAKHVYAVVISHDCEFNEGKRDQFLAARIRQLDPRLTEDQLQELRSGNEAAARAEAGETVAIDTFYLDPLPGVFDEPRLVDFCTITPFPMKVATAACTLKRAELEHEDRVRLREKLALFVGRTAEDVPEDQKFDAPSEVAATQNEPEAG